MSSTFGNIELGKRSLMAHTQQISTAGHNISNADTQGYSRQRVQVKAMDPLYRPDLSRAETPGQLGQGTSIESVTRLRDELLDQRIVAQSNRETYWETRDKYYSMIEDIYNEPEEISVRGNMDKYWQGWQELSMYPESQAARQAVVTRGESLAESIQQRFKSLSGVGTLINGDIEGSVRQVNNLTKQIAALNEEIVKSKAIGDNPNDL
ncbi:MAG: flagellar hook-associated protein FlgK, partial [Treponema sp.]|nr:flagellar hook-associated protein FlgK [Treponema sp.]